LPKTFAGCFTIVPIFKIDLKDDGTIDDIIRVQFPLDPENSHICVADCNVVRTIGSVNYSMRRYGCEFSEVSASDRQLINAYLTQLRTKQMRIEQSLI